MSIIKKVGADIDDNIIYLIDRNICISEVGQLFFMVNDNFFETDNNYAVNLNKIDENTLIDSIKNRIFDIENIVINNFKLNLVDKTIKKMGLNIDSCIYSFDICTSKKNMQDNYKTFKQKILTPDKNTFKEVIKKADCMIIFNDGLYFFCKDNLILRCASTIQDEIKYVEAIMDVKNYKITNYISFNEIS